MRPKTLSNEQLKKLSLGAIGFVALLYVYFSFLLGPLQNTRQGMVAKMEDLEKKISDASPETARVANLERQASKATQRFSALQSLTPEGAPIAWFPPRIKTFFANAGIDKATARMESNTPFGEPELAGWAHYTWLIDIPQADFAALASAIADLENAEPLLAIKKVSIKSAAEGPEFQQATLNASTTLVKR